MRNGSRSLLFAIVFIFPGAEVRAQQSPVQTLQGMLAAQTRTQGFTCEKPIAAKKNTKSSRPDREVWVLKCGNAMYRIRRVPDMAAKVESLP